MSSGHKAANGISKSVQFELSGSVRHHTDRMLGITLPKRNAFGGLLPTNRFNLPLRSQKYSHEKKQTRQSPVRSRATISMSTQEHCPSCDWKARVANRLRRWGHC
jgi:hypothetical protein